MALATTTHCNRGHEYTGATNSMGDKSCKLCQAEAQKVWYLANKEAHKEKTKAARILRKYGLSQKDWNRIFASQDSRCAICRTKSASRWCVDHNHQTGEVRGILCHPCNIGIGYLKENIAVLYNAIQYLDR